MGSIQGSEDVRWVAILACRTKLRDLLASRLPDADVEGRLQDVLVKAYAKLHNFEARRDPWPLLVKISLGVVRDWHRKRGRLCKQSLETRGEVYVSRTPLPLEVLQQAERRACIRCALRNLPPMQRKLMWLHHWRDWPIERIAARLGLPEHSVCYHLKLGRAAMKALLRAAIV